MHSVDRSDGTANQLRMGSVCIANFPTGCQYVGLIVLVNILEQKFSSQFVIYFCDLLQSSLKIYFAMLGPQSCRCYESFINEVRNYVGEDLDVFIIQQTAGHILEHIAPVIEYTSLWQNMNMFIQDLPRLYGGHRCEYVRDIIDICVMHWDSFYPRPYYDYHPNSEQESSDQEECDSTTA